jgi:hypothetical protein
MLMVQHRVFLCNIGLYPLQVFSCLAFNATDCLLNLQLLRQGAVPLLNDGGRTVRVFSEKTAAANQEV